MYYSDFSLFARQIRLELSAGQVPSENLIRQIIGYHTPDRNKMIQLHQRYAAKADGVPVFQRVNTYGKNVFNMIAHNYFKKIVNTKIGYYASQISYQYDDSNDKTDDTTPNKTLQDFVKRSSMGKVDVTTAKFMSICGYGVKLLYLKGGDLKVQNVNPYECVFISETEEPQYCLRHYPITTVDSNGQLTMQETMVEFYDSTWIHKFILNERISEGGTKGFKHLSSDKHLLAGLPIIQFKNNAEMSPECDDAVLSMIDAVDSIVSNGTDETGELANAYMVLVNLSLGNTPEERENKKAEMVKSGVLTVGENGDVRFVTKNLPVDFFAMLLKWLDEHIYSFGSSIDYNNPEIGALSGVALKNKMLGLETSCILSENEFRAASLELFRIASNFWAVKGQAVDYLNIKLTLPRNYPLDLEAEARASGMLQGIISKKTQLSLLTFVKDVDGELKQIAKEDAESPIIDLDAVPDEGADMPPAGMMTGDALRMRANE